MMLDRFVVATFCDDIRYETGNKHSLMGCYKDDLVVDQLPVALPKLCAVVQIRTPIDQPFMSNLIVNATLDGESVGLMEFTEDRLEGLKREMVARELSGMKKAEINCHFTFSPLVITQEGRLTIDVLADGEPLNREFLMIRVKSQELAQ